MIREPYAIVDDRWRLCNLETVVLETDQLRVVVLPDCGAHVQQITHKPSDRELLWENPRQDPRPPIFGERWSGWLGGIDEMIPTGWASTHQGSSYPDHGEVISQRWSHDVLDRGPREASVRFFCNGFVSPMRVERTMTLRAGESSIRMAHRVTNLGERDLDFLWGLHTSFNGHYDYRLDIPAGKVFEEHYRARFFDGGPIGSYDWPLMESPSSSAQSPLAESWEQGPDEPQAHLTTESARPSTTGVESSTSVVDMTRPQPGPEMVLHYAMARDGWLAFSDLDRDIGMAVRFDKEVFPVIGLWILRGRYGHRVTAVVPWTGYPLRLEEAAGDKGISATLGPGESLVTETHWIVYRGVKSVAGVSSDGVILPGAT